MAHKRRRSGRPDATGRSTKPDRFLQIPHFLLASPAWQSLGPVHRALFIEVAQRWTGFNNGQIGLGVRQAAEALHVKPDTVGKAFDVLIERGFLVMTKDSSFHQKRLTREWRVTLFPMGDCRAPSAPPTRHYARWRAPPEKQKPVPKGDTHRPDSGYRNRLDGADRSIQWPQSGLSGRFPASHSPERGHASNYHDSTGVRSLRDILPAVVNGTRAA